MEFRILGPLDVVDGERVVALPGAKHRALLAMLLLHANEVVSTERLTEALWEDEPPETAPEGAPGLRLAAAEGARRRPPAHEGARLPDPGRRRRARPPAVRAARCRTGSRARRSRSGAGRRSPSSPTRTSRRPRSPDSTSCHLSCLEQRIDADLAAGRHARARGRARGARRRAPTQGARPRQQLMLALYRSGRQAEALTTYRDAPARSRRGAGHRARAFAPGARAGDPAAGPGARCERRPRRASGRRRPGAQRRCRPAP